jgi:hypothetical protein
MAVDHQLWTTRHVRRPVRGVAVALFGGIMLTAASAMAQPEAVTESPPPVEILRGSVAPPPPPRIEPSGGVDERLVIAGERLWLVDEASGRLTGCRLINTIDVGRQAIRCTERRLPRARPARD